MRMQPYPSPTHAARLSRALEAWARKPDAVRASPPRKFSWQTPERPQ